MIATIKEICDLYGSCTCIFRQCDTSCACGGSHPVKAGDKYAPLKEEAERLSVESGIPHKVVLCMSHPGGDKNAV